MSENEIENRSNEESGTSNEVKSASETQATVSNSISIQEQGRKPLYIEGETLGVRLFYGRKKKARYFGMTMSFEEIAERVRLAFPELKDKSFHLEFDDGTYIECTQDWECAVEYFLASLSHTSKEDEALAKHRLKLQIVVDPSTAKQTESQAKAEEVAAVVVSETEEKEDIDMADKSVENRVSAEGMGESVNDYMGPSPKRMRLNDNSAYPTSRPVGESYEYYGQYYPPRTMQPPPPPPYVPSRHPPYPPYPYPMHAVPGTYDPRGAAPVMPPDPRQYPKRSQKENNERLQYLWEQMKAVMQKYGKAMDVLHIRKELTIPQHQMPKTKELNHILYQHHQRGELTKEQPDPNKKPLWSLVSA